MAETPLHSAMVPVQRMEPAIDAGVLTTLAMVCRGPLHVGYRCPGLRTYVTGVRAGVHQQAEQAHVVQHQPREVMAKIIPPSAATLEAIDDTTLPDALRHRPAGLAGLLADGAGRGVRCAGAAGAEGAAAPGE